MKRNWIVFTLGLAVLTLAAVGLQAQDHSYVSADKCKMCHKVQFTSWESTSHAKALEAAKGSTDPAFSSDCLKCHATNADETMGGVQCEACHGPGSDYKKMSVMKDREQAEANGLVIPSQATCDRCHMDNGHSKAVVLADEMDNKAAIHEFKNPPGK